MSNTAVLARPRIESGIAQGSILIIDDEMSIRESLETRSEEHTSELQSQSNLVCRLLLEKKKKIQRTLYIVSHTCTTSSILSLYPLMSIPICSNSCLFLAMPTLLSFSSHFSSLFAVHTTS